MPKPKLNIYVVIINYNDQYLFAYVVDQFPDNVVARIKKVLPDGAFIRNIQFLSRADDAIGNLAQVPESDDLVLADFSVELIQVIDILAKMNNTLNSSNSCIYDMLEKVEFNRYSYCTLVDGREIWLTVFQKSLPAAFVMADDFVKRTYGENCEVSQMQLSNK